MNHQPSIRISLGLLVCMLSTFAFSVKCDAQQGKKATKKESSVNVGQESIGINLIVEVKTGNASSKLQFEGTLKRLTDKDLVLENVTKTARNEQGVPMLEDIPYVARLFKNVGIASEKVEGSVFIKRENIIKISRASKKPLTPPAVRQN